MVTIGYARVSPSERSSELQAAALREAGCDRIFTDHDGNGKLADKSELNAVLDHLRPGDELVIWRLDRLGRTTKKLLPFFELLDTKGVTFRSLTEGITTTGPNGKAMLTILTALARLERDTTTKRTQAGMAFAAAHGRRGGRPVITAENAAVKRAHELKAAGLRPIDIGRMTGRSRATIYRYLDIGRDGRT